MSQTKCLREKKRQLGQFLTPEAISRKIVRSISLSKEHRILEPSMGDGSFIEPLIESFLPFYTGPMQKRLDAILANNIWGVEIDKELFEKCFLRIKNRWGYLPKVHNFINQDFFLTNFVGKNGFPIKFDFVIGNPPFGGSFDRTIEDSLDATYGMRDGQKIKKETYAFFIVKGTDILKTGGELILICSDTFLTINTMRGLRQYLMARGDIEVQRLNEFSAETSHPMVILKYRHKNEIGKVIIEGRHLFAESIKKTGNLSFGLKPEFERYFDGPCLGDFFVATSGMTTGRNEYFVREIEGGKIKEPYRFVFVDEPITVETELKKARLGYISVNALAKFQMGERLGVMRRGVQILPREKPLSISLPHGHYWFYNKGNSDIVYAKPTHVIYWKDDGDAVKTYKKNGNWYLRGVGGEPFFGREGITWQLIAKRFYTKYLPASYILDSGAPCAFPREHVPQEEIYFILAWTLTEFCNRILKEVINHTKNIQSKDFERLPYPFWVSTTSRRRVIELVKKMVNSAVKTGTSYNALSPEIKTFESFFEFSKGKTLLPPSFRTRGMSSMPTALELPFPVATSTSAGLNTP